ncbi:primosomal protein [Mycolicibacterium brumae]|uniref:Primosomal protein n=1 Tax=Mycolicibacterium brumae TaxID=85968 RepID=A0A2G5PB19_9MYCO|nr:primosomal protein [Mycolicibacterium brumae]MCV7193279.1 primosomal protein [Mycolicibacterium brumae]PIB75558.1 primosomal protein [Mycolicibacterium brumae]UWW09935.1 primosomal protein [Mycolicibacterium brumae]
MAADLVPIRLSVTAGDLYTLWAPPWRDAGDEWEAFLGKDEDLYGFASAADLAAFVRSGAENDLSDHPAWAALTEANAHALNPDEDHHFDLLAVEELAAEKPSETSVTSLASTLAVVSAIGSVCELPAVTKFFNGNPSLVTLNNGVDEFSGRAGRKRWDAIAAVIARNWEKVLAAIDEVLSTPEVDEKASAKAAEELEADPPVIEEEDVLIIEEDDDAEGAETAEDGDGVEPGAVRAAGDTAVLGSDADFWGRVGIDPIRLMIGSGTFYTLRCYFRDRPIFLGRNGRISVFSSERALARYLADEHDHDLADLVTYDDIRTAATDGSLVVKVTDENVYVLTGLADDIADGADAVDHDQLELAVELLRDVGDYSEEDTVEKALASDAALGAFVSHVLDGADAPAKPAEAVSSWEKLERFVESRLRRE